MVESKERLTLWFVCVSVCVFEYVLVRKEERELEGEREGIYTARRLRQITANFHQT